jgi:hypothetical protein
MIRLLRTLAPAALLLLVPSLHAWDYEGHRIVNTLALAALPGDFPAFTRTPAATERIAFLAGEGDRWRNVPDLPLKQSGGSWTDHFLDLEYLPEAGLDPAQLPSFRYDFIVQFAAGRAAHPENFPAIDPARNTDHTREWPGFAPWAIAEYFGRLRSAFSYLRVFEELGTPEEIENARANVIHYMGAMGHYVGDCAQPLHSTKHYNGWTGANPKGYTRWNGLHAWIDGGIIAKAGIRSPALTPRIGGIDPVSMLARSDGRDPVFVAALEFIIRQHAHVATIYDLEKAGRLGHGDGPMTDEARALIEDRLVDGGRMLGAIWLAAWRSAVPDTYLRSALVRRQAARPPAP